MSTAGIGTNQRLDLGELKGFAGLYRISLYVMLVLAALVLNIDAARDNPIAPLYPVAVTVAAVVAFLTVDRRPEMGIPRRLANVLGFAAFALGFLEFWIGRRLSENLLVLSLGHLLVYLLLIKMFMPKEVEDDWLLFLLGLMQVMVGTVQSQSDRVGWVLGLWVLATLWSLALFYLHRESRRQWQALGDDPANSPRSLASDPYPGLFDAPFFAASLRMVLVTLTLGGVIFLILPRNDVLLRGRGSFNIPTRHATGYTDSVRLGQFGEILESEEIVMSVELYDDQSQKVAPASELLWRGVTLAQYKDRRWYRQALITQSIPDRVSQRFRATNRLLRQQIKLEPTDTEALFALRPIVQAVADPTSVPQLNVLDGALYRPSAGSRLRLNPFEYAASSRPFDYTVWTTQDPAPGTIPYQPLEEYPNPERLQELIQVPDQPAGMRERLQAIADPVIDGIPRDHVAGQARALESYLRDSNRFHYTLQMGVIDPKLDPIEDFLSNRKRGHCEYFASALVMLLRAEGIPARLVHGFKGGDWNDLARSLTVRQKHAHSWVEALTGINDQGRPLWLTLDPTPAGERDEAVASVGGIRNIFRPITDFVRFIWVFYIVGFDASRQKRVLYDPIQTLAQQAGKGFSMMGTALRSGFQGIHGWLGGYSLFSIPGFVGTVVLLLLLATCWLLLRWGLRRFLNWWRGPDAEASGLAESVTFYHRAMQLLAEYGLRRPPAETPQEFARRASAFLARHEVAAVADIPPQIVEAFYRIRFGHLELNPDQVQQLEARLDALEAALKAPG